MSRRERQSLQPAPDRAIDDDALDALTRRRLWNNPCWLSARLNILANRFNVPMYGWIESRFGLSRPEFVVLYSLGLSNDIAASQISTSTGFPKNTLSRAINRLLRMKLVQRKNDPTDKRCQRLLLSARGKAVVDEAMPRLYAREGEMLACLRPDERETLAGLMAKMVVALEGRDDHAAGGE